MKYIVITSIFPPTEAVRKFAELDGYRVVVVADRKTPRDWRLDGVECLSLDQQAELGFKVIKHLPYNNYQRKMAGYVHAIKSGATTVVDTDDDNIPYPGWGFPAFSGDYPLTERNQGVINVYACYSDQRIWPRGLPLNLIKSEWAQPARTNRGAIEVGIWQALANGDPDVDAVYRLTDNRECIFQKNGQVVLDEGTLCPFNTQNTVFSEPALALLYLPVTTTFRCTDILRGYVAQPVLWTRGLRLGFTEATVFQKRNPHDHMRDFELEIPLYLHAEKVIETIAAMVKAKDSVADNLYNAYAAICAAGILQSREMPALEAWLEDIA